MTLGERALSAVTQIKYCVRKEDLEAVHWETLVGSTRNHINEEDSKTEWLYYTVLEAMLDARQDEREACANACDNVQYKHNGEAGEHNWACRKCADTIRARGNNNE